MRVENLKEETMIEANRRPTVVVVEEIMIKWVVFYAVLSMISRASKTGDKIGQDADLQIFWDAARIFLMHYEALIKLKTFFTYI